MLLEEEHTVMSLTSPEMTSPGNTALRARAVAGRGETASGRAAAARGWSPPQGSCVVAPCTRSLQVWAPLATPTRSDSGGHWVTAGSPGQAGGPGSTVPARARLHTASRRHSMAGKCRLLPGCTRSTSPSNTCTRPRWRGPSCGELGAVTFPRRGPLPMRQSKAPSSRLEGDTREPPSLRETPLLHTPQHQQEQGQQCLPLLLSAPGILLSLCLLKGVPVLR